ncbi:hypothetical protein ACTFIW_003663 [Dictyostelium discoideum]
MHYQIPNIRFEVRKLTFHRIAKFIKLQEKAENYESLSAVDQQFHLFILLHGAVIEVDQLKNLPNLSVQKAFDAPRSTAEAHQLMIGLQYYSRKILLNIDSIAIAHLSICIPVKLFCIDQKTIQVKKTAWQNERGTQETIPQEESELDWRAYSRILQCKSRPPQPSFRDESHIIIQINQELQLATEEGSVQSHPTSFRSNTDLRISPEPSNEQLLNNQNECTLPRLESMEAMSVLPTTHSFVFYPGEDELIQFEEGFYNTDLPNLEISNLVSDDSSTSSSSSSSHVSPSSGNIPRSIDQTISRVNTNPNSITLETGDYSTFQSHVMSIIRIQKSSKAELLMKSWEPSTLKVYSSSYTRFRNFCTSNLLNPANITLVFFMDYLTHLFKHKPPLAFSTINGHRSMLNQLLLLKNQTDIVNDPFVTRIMTGIHKLRPSSAKYQEIWDTNQVFKYLSTIKVIPKYTYTELLKKTLVLCKMFGLARLSDLVKWSFNGLIITPDSIKGPVIKAKEQRKGVLSILELTSASKGRRNLHSGDSVFIQNEGKPLDVKEINIIVLSTLSSSGIDISKFKYHSTRSAMASLLLSNNVPFHVVKKMGRWKSNDTVDTFYDKRIIGEKSGGSLNTVVQIS